MEIKVVYFATFFYNFLKMRGGEEYTLETVYLTFEFSTSAGSGGILWNAFEMKILKNV